MSRLTGALESYTPYPAVHPRRYGRDPRDIEGDAANEDAGDARGRGLMSAPVARSERGELLTQGSRREPRREGRRGRAGPTSPGEDQCRAPRLVFTAGNKSSCR